MLLNDGFGRIFHHHCQQRIVGWWVTGLEIGDDRVKSRPIVFFDAVTQGHLDTVELTLTVAGRQAV